MKTLPFSNQTTSAQQTKTPIPNPNHPPHQPLGPQYLLDLNNSSLPLSKLIVKTENSGKPKRKKRNLTPIPPPLTTPPLHNPSRGPWIAPYDKTADEIIDLGLQLEMNYNGPLSDLKSKIRGILARQERE